MEKNMTVPEAYTELVNTPMWYPPMNRQAGSDYKRRHINGAGVKHETMLAQLLDRGYAIKTPLILRKK